MFRSRFYINQKVFAKVRGCPVWPGMICDTFQTPNELTHLVYLYGIDMSVKVKEDKLQDYHQYIQQHGSQISLHLVLAKAIQTSLHFSCVDSIGRLADVVSTKGNEPTLALTSEHNDYFTDAPNQNLKKIELHFQKSTNKLECSRTTEISRWKVGEYSPTHQLKTELKLLLCDFRIKSSIRLSGANCIDCLNAMNKILKLPLNKLILKKHPQVVKTVLRLRRYTGNVQSWQLTTKQKRVFAEHACEIRDKAKLIFNNFRKIFGIPNNVDFNRLYCMEITQFHRKVKPLSHFQLFTLTKE